MHPEIAKTLAGQRREELTRYKARYTAESRRDPGPSAGPGWLSRRVPRWHVSWSRTVLSPGQRGSSLVIIISAYR
jgi:hypothetical protein